MKSLNRSRYALNLYVVSALLAGCGGSQVLPATPLQPNLAQWAMPGTSGPLRGEIFRGSKVAITTTCHGSEGAHFRASGAASGPFRGTFSVSGSWTGSRQGIYVLWKFDERFSISSGRSTISGRIDGQGLGDFAECRYFYRLPSIEHLGYRTKQGGGVVVTSEIKEKTSFSQRFK